MNKRLVLILAMTAALVLILFSVGTALAQDNPDAILGDWLTEKGTAGITIYKCGKEFCGKVSWLKEPKDKDGKDKVDDKNPDATKKTRPIMGMNLVWGFEYKGGNKWEDGAIYDPEEGKTYKCKMTLDGEKLNVRGYVGISLIGRTTVWSKKK
ncbi:MAG: DUF2147 domain-containing protein [Thermodesulfobacteriota bacterium]